MPKYLLDDYKDLVKKERKDWFKSPYKLVYDNFIKLGYDKKDSNYFKQNASTIIENIRKSCWNEFRPSEKDFTSKMIQSLIDKKSIESLTPAKAISWFAEEYPEHIYALNLSNTQSRRSRAGKEFEAIIELILIGAGIPMDTQGNIGKKEFIKKGLGKLVDVVSPGVAEYMINKRNTVLISAKTTLRERWQEVPEEMGRTGAREMFLATLDPSISDEVLETLYEANIQVTTTKSIKQKYYASNPRVLDFEELIEICLDNFKQWKDFNHSDDYHEQVTKLLKKQIQKNKEFEYVNNYYKTRLINLSKTHRK